MRDRQLAIAYDSLVPPLTKEAKEQRAEADRIVKTIDEINRLQLKAMEDPWDAPVRLEIAKLCEKIHRPKEAEMWRRAAEASQLPR